MAIATNKNAIPFVYIVQTSSLSNGQTFTQPLIFDTASYFEWRTTLGTTNATNETTAVSPNNFTLQITDQGTGRQMTSGKVPQSILCGNSFNNGIYPTTPIRIMPGSNFVFDFTNTSGGNAIITVALHGFKLFDLISGSAS